MEEVVPDTAGEDHGASEEEEEVGEEVIVEVEAEEIFNLELWRRRRRRRRTLGRRRFLTSID